MENLKKKEADDLSLFDGSTQHTSTLKVLSYNDMGPFLIEDGILIEKMAASNFQEFVYTITLSTVTLSCRMNVYIVCHIQRQILITQKHIM